MGYLPIKHRRTFTAAAAWMALLGSFAQGTAGLAQEPEAEAPDPLEEVNPWIGDPDAYMIAVEFLVVEVNENRTRELGVHYGFANNDVDRIINGADVIFGPTFNPALVPTFGNDPNARQTGVGFTPRLPGLGVTLSGSGANGGVVSARLRALLDQGDARIVTRPIALALNGTEVTINIGSMVPYQDVADPNKGTGLKVAFENIGVNLAVTPTIADLQAQTVHLNIGKIEVSQLSNFVTSQNVDRPVFNKSETSITKITIRSGDTYKMSDLKGERNRTFREGLPVLMDIPFIGHFFSSREEVLESVDILFFVTPHIVPPGRNILLPYDFEHGEDLVSSRGVVLPE